MLKDAGSRLLCNRIVGTMDYYCNPKLGVAWGGPFNGQPARQALFSAIVADIRPKAIIETGTYFGTTTEFMALTGLPVFTIEADPRRFGFARARLWKRRNVTLLLGDSRAALLRLVGSSLRQFLADILFFYLDAHWNDDLPLGEELEIIFSRCPAAVVMIDDFQVPFDAGYGYDDYGAGKALVRGYIAPTMSAHGLQEFYPSTSSVEESGERRGCVVLAKGATLVSILSSLTLLRSYNIPIAARALRYHP